MAGNRQAASPATAAAALQKDGADAKLPEPAKITAMTLPEGFKVAKVLTLPSLSLKDGQGIMMEIKTKPVVSDVVDKKNQKDPAIVADVVNLETGVLTRWLIPSVAMGNFINEYSKTPEGKEAALKLRDSITKEQPLAVRTQIQRDALAAADVQIVGKFFAVQHMGKRSESQRYNDYNIAELQKA